MPSLLALLTDSRSLAQHFVPSADFFFPARTSVVGPTTMAQEVDLAMAAVGGGAVFIGIRLAFKDTEWMFKGVDWIELVADILCLLDGSGASP